MNADISKYARDLRNNPTPFEIIVWRHLSRSQLGGFKFRRQAVIGPFVCDFFCPARGLIVEIDGDTHDAAGDQARDTRTKDMGFTTLRFTNADVAHALEGVLLTILNTLNSLPDRWDGSHRGPHPNPSPEGEGLSG